MANTNDPIQSPENDVQMKQPKTYEEQVELIEKKGFLVENIPNSGKFYRRSITGQSLRTTRMVDG